MTGLGLLVLRVSVAAVCVMHGAHKLFGFGGGVGTGVGPGGLTDTAQHFSQIGLNPGFLLAVLAGLTQFAGGLLLGVGFLTRWAASALGVYFLLGIWKEHSPWGFFLNWTNVPALGHGYEYALIMLAAVVCLALTGGGEWSLDGRRAKSAESMAAGRARLRGHG